VPPTIVVPKGSISALVQLKLREIEMRGVEFVAKVEFDAAALALQHVHAELQLAK
jgi:hypothetical protein